jgi:hypothetical protein
LAQVPAPSLGSQSAKDFAKRFEELPSYSGDPNAKEFRDFCPLPHDETDRFCTELLRSAQLSVDAFLEHRTEFLDIGKAAIAFMLVRKETPQTLWKFSDDNWLRYMFDKLNLSALANMYEIPVSFITFNYDRSLPFFLHTVFQSRYKMTTDESAAVLERIPIIHLHGRLGYLPWQKTGESRPYEPVVSRDVLDICVKSIKVVHEDSSRDGRDADFREAQRLLGLAECIYYLGFGYGPVNMERLNIRALQPTATYGTGFGLTNRECSDIVQLAGDGTQRINPLNSLDCIQLLRNYVDWS